MLRIAAALAALLVPNHPPEFELPPYHRVAPGHEIAFGLNAIDQDGDTVIVELIDKPASAKVDPLTLTVTWKPTAKDAPAGRFRVKVTEVQRKGGSKRSFLHDFSIAVDPKAKDLPAPQPLDPAVELLITVHDPERLAQVNKEWPIDKMLGLMGRVELGKLAPDAQKAAAPTDQKKLYADTMAAVGGVHRSTRDLGPPSNWKITAIRPRMDKKMQELRVVYENIKAPEPVYLMFRWRLVRDNPDLTPDVKEFANKEFTRLVYESFFVGPDLNPKFLKDKKAHGKAVAAFVGNVLDYKSDKFPTMGTEFMALPHEARLGGGTARTGDDTYASGDGWAWAVLKPKWTDDHKLTVTSVPIPGFTTEIKPTPDGTAWATVCAPKFDPDDPKHVPGYEVLCRKKLGFTDLPQKTRDGKVASAAIDATNLFIEHKLGDLVALVDLRDPRRDNFEENGMTCSQCHVRDFGNGDPRDKSVRDPRAGKPANVAASIPTTFFNIVPEETWRPFTIEFQKLQQCLFKDAFKKFQGVDTNLVCPLVAE